MKKIARCSAVLRTLAVAYITVNVSETATSESRPDAGRGDVVVSATQQPQNSFDLPVAIDSVGRERIQEQQAQVNLSESLGQVPGMVVQNRQNYAQDLQISSRGFGARTTFGVRGIRLIADGIPATMPDGQGQVSTFDLSTAQRIEVLRGPFSSLYGNASGGVIQVFTEDGPAQGTMLRTSLLAGSFDTRRAGVVVGGQGGDLNYILDGSHFATDGYRDHSAASRDYLNGKFKYAVNQDTKLTLVLNGFHQPDTQDPLGLTSAQVAANPKQTDPVATTFNTRKSVKQDQAGLVLEQRLGERDSLQLVTYLGQRDVTQYLALSGSGATSSGGVVDLDRGYDGLRTFWTHKAGTVERPVTLTVGVDLGRMQEHRRGFVNNNGTAGDLRRDEDDTVSNSDVLLQGEWRIAPSWVLSAGARHSRVAFDSADHYITGPNPDDSGSITYTKTSPVAGLVFMATPALNLYASLGKGFETPTFAELAYRPSGATGLNFDLAPSRSTNAEIGLKAFAGLHSQLKLALFNIDTRDEIVVNSATGGRTNYKNAPRTERTGIELSGTSVLGGGFETAVAYTHLDARFRDSYTSGAPPTTVPAGNRLPGVPRDVLYAELVWKDKDSGLSTGLEARANSKVYVDDMNSASAPGYGIANWRIGFEQRGKDWRLAEFLRADNLFDKSYIGSVIVADTNFRYYEPAPGRSWMLGLNASMGF